MSARTLLWLIATVLLLLALWQGLRVIQLGRRRDERERREGDSAGGRTAEMPRRPRQTALAVTDDADDSEDDADALDYGLSLRRSAVVPADAAPAAAAPVTPDGELFAAQLELRRVQRELGAQQQLVRQQQQKIEALNSELSLLRQSLADEQVQAEDKRQPTASPEYAEPLRLAEMGFKDEEIAARCGITLAEAGLVLAMARRGGRG